jgi:hypothetical protein
MRWVIADSVTPSTRVALLEQLAADATTAAPVRAMAAMIAQDAAAFVRAESALALVHSIPYRADPAGAEVFQDALETIAYGGDCEDLAVLFVALARSVGLDARVVWLDQQIHGSALNHVFARENVDGRWLDAECSIAGARLGEAPGTAASRLRR